MIICIFLYYRFLYTNVNIRDKITPVLNCGTNYIRICKFSFGLKFYSLYNQDVSVNEDYLFIEDRDYEI